MIVAVTLSRYIARQFLLWVLIMIAALTGIICLFDLIDLFRRVSSRPEVSSNIVTEIAGLHVPYFAIEILPFGILLGGIVCFWRLTRSSELVVARAAGLSVWQFLAAPLTCAVLLGVLATCVISPFSSVMYRRAADLDQQYLRSDGGPLSLSGGSLWLRQADTQYDPHGVTMLHAGDVQVTQGQLHIRDISVFRLDHEDKLIMRIESPRGSLKNAGWELTEASVVRPNNILTPVGVVILPTSLTLERVQESFASPDTLSVWALPGFITLLDHSGFSSIRHRIHFQSLLALPILAGTMALVSAGFSMRSSRRGGVAKMVGSGVAAGFLLFTISKVAEQLGKSGALPPVLAAWAPTLAGLCLAVALLLHLEDG
ncbi:MULTISPECIES: LPS export ABC transporter permease LptG [Acetobacter]|jgi:lipopolysaccharide export system permease protein|uniref:Lipopolysaccharide export system permease protein n=2 Tax=Acetobacter TaxID=434 RepID=A0A841QBD6_9PROT|nr:LPS export ABC transporter permease LptG [Acetobacter lovaniensis]MBB6455738.1 lipopolysaccharide export system permease protein [Acetobacter lovaniensis]MCI1697330.1 LPS export ABC transporter permease LptG [Acetobacter lovaniensis]MCI1795550.1 LPS export ABC transporter permease LptG [Acetobacter lovaniensis]MCP1238429.1 LPS export ABC transporter permease LptG [Acetobacter lovaniensis]NHN80134.1 LPS export ABC transporter permease LptG [Acetobacter lovaniensis]